MSDCDCLNCGPICPTCGNEYQSQEGMRTHHAKTHGEKIECIARERDVPCPSCDRMFVSENAVKQHHVQTHGESLTRVEMECAVCETTKEINQWRAEMVESWTCSDQCHRLLKRLQMKDRDIDWGHKISDSLQQYFEENGPHTEGEDHWRFKGGRAERERLSPKFKEAVRVSRGRECEQCGKHGSEQDRALSVHHIDEDPTNNDLDNLEVLCRSCHVTGHVQRDKLKS